VAPQTDTAMLLSVVIVNWNSRSDLQACLRSLALQTHEALQIIVIDNGSTDGSTEMVQEAFPTVKLLPQTSNLGFAEACNIGIDASDGSWVCMLNNDTVAEPGWAEALVRAIERAPEDCGMLQALMLYTSRPDVINSTGIELTTMGLGRDRSEGKPRDEGGVAAEIFCPTAGAAAYRRRMLDELRLEGGCFDREHFMYYEDLDLGWRARLAGWSAHYVPDAIVHHVWHGSSHRHGDAWLRRLEGTNRMRTLFKNASWRLLLMATPATVRMVVQQVRLDGPKALGKMGKAAVDAWRARATVEGLRSRDRRAVEERWGKL
jgi:GT2 family glycosyltransferase